MASFVQELELSIFGFTWRSLPHQTTYPLQIFMSCELSSCRPQGCTKAGQFCRCITSCQKDFVFVSTAGSDGMSPCAVRRGAAGKSWRNAGCGRWPWPELLCSWCAFGFSTPRCQSAANCVTCDSCPHTHTLHTPNPSFLSSILELTFRPRLLPSPHVRSSRSAHSKSRVFLLLISSSS